MTAFETRFMRRCGRSSGERFVRLSSLVCLIDRYDAEQDSSEVCLPLNHAARVLGRTREDLEADLAYLGGTLGCLNWFTLIRDGVRLAVIHHGDRPLHADNGLWDRAYSVLRRLSLTPPLRGGAAA